MSRRRRSDLGGAVLTSGCLGLGRMLWLASIASIVQPACSSHGGSEPSDASDSVGGVEEGPVDAWPAESARIDRSTDVPVAWEKTTVATGTAPAASCTPDGNTVAWFRRDPTAEDVESGVDSFVVEIEREGEKWPVALSAPVRINAKFPARFAIADYGDGHVGLLLGASKSDSGFPEFGVALLNLAASADAASDTFPGIVPGSVRTWGSSLCGLVPSEEPGSVLRCVARTASFPIVLEVDGVAGFLSRGPWIVTALKDGGSRLRHSDGALISRDPEILALDVDAEGRGLWAEDAGDSSEGKLVDVLRAESDGVVETLVEGLPGYVSGFEPLPRLPFAALPEGGTFLLMQPGRRLAWVDPVTQSVSTVAEDVETGPPWGGTVDSAFLPIWRVPGSQPQDGYWIVWARDVDDDARVDLVLRRIGDDDEVTITPCGSHVETPRLQISDGALFTHPFLSGPGPGICAEEAEGAPLLRITLDTLVSVVGPALDPALPTFQVLEDGVHILSWRRNDSSDPLDDLDSLLGTWIASTAGGESDGTVLSSAAVGHAVPCGGCWLFFENPTIDGYQLVRACPMHGT